MQIHIIISDSFWWNLNVFYIFCKCAGDVNGEFFQKLLPIGSETQENQYIRFKLLSNSGTFAAFIKNIFLPPKVLICFDRCCGVAKYERGGEELGNCNTK